MIEIPNYIKKEFHKMQEENKSLSSKMNETRDYGTNAFVFDLKDVKEFIKEDLELIKLLAGQKISYGELLVRRNKRAGKDLI